MSSQKKLRRKVRAFQRSPRSKAIRKLSKRRNDKYTKATPGRIPCSPPPHLASTRPRSPPLKRARKCPSESRTTKLKRNLRGSLRIEKNTLTTTSREEIAMKAVKMEKNLTLMLG